MGEGCPGFAELQHRPQAGHFHRGELRSDICRDDLSFLCRSFERHFNERPYLNHTCLKTTKEHSCTTSSFNALTRRFIIPKEVQDKDTVAHFLDRSDCRLSFVAPIRILLTCSYIVNQYFFIDDSAENLRKFEQTARNMHSLSCYSRSNQINREWIEEYLNEAHSKGLTSIRTYCNVFAWSDDREKLKRIKNDVGSQLALMGPSPIITWSMCRHLLVSHSRQCRRFPVRGKLLHLHRTSPYLFIGETFYKDSLSPFGIRMVRQYYEQGAHVLLVDTENSYQGLCSLIHARTHGEDGIYITYEEDNPIAFNPFYTDSGEFDVEKRESIKTLMLILWKREDEAPRRSKKVVLSGAVNAYIRRITGNKDVRADFNGFYEFVRDDYRRMIEEKKVREKDFDIDSFLNVLEPFYRVGDCDFLLNSEKELDLTKQMLFCMSKNF